jgi:hypothetical protein
LPAGFVIYRTSESSGFSASPWTNYSQILMGSPTPVTAWLLSQGLPYDTDMRSDENGDGVSLLMAYALNLDPHQNLSGSLPQPVFATDQMNLTFYAGTAGVSYSVETCTNFSDWTTEGVTLSEPDGNEMRTGTVERTGPKRYLRLKVSN